MKLLQSPPSPFARKARVAVIECGLADKVEEVPVVARPDGPDPILIENNPLGKIPCLVLEDGSSLFDSRAITRYLDTISGKGLYPEGGWHVLSLESIGDGIMDAAVSMVYEKRFRPENMVFSDWLDWQWEKVTRALDALEEYWIPTLSNGLTAGHISVGCAMGYLDFRHADRDWRDGRSRLAAWSFEFLQKPSMMATAPED